MHTVRLLPFAAASGSMNMARDEALLHAAADRGVATLRFYTWAEPTVTLGYFQASAERLPNLSHVRRSTGGAAIVHDPAHEITYSLALPPGPDWQPPGESWSCQMHYTIRDVLKSMGVSAKVVVCGEERKLGEVLCFLHHTPGDLVVEAGSDDLFSTSPLEGEVGETKSSRVGGSENHPPPADTYGVADLPLKGGGGKAAHKIAGSAQRKWKGALLQHGSVLFSRSPLTPQLPGIAELSGVRVNGKHLAAAVVERFTTVTGWRVEPGDWTADELRHADRILADKYASADWNEKR